MIVGFTYNGKHSIRDMGLVFKIRTRPVSQPKENIEEMQCIDGTMDFSDYLGRTFYADKVLELDLYAKKSNPIALNSDIGKMIRWLNCGYSDLIFDDMPTMIWKAKVTNISSISESLQMIGMSTIQFRCKPFNEFLYSKGIKLGDKIKLGSVIPIGIGSDKKYTISNGSNSINIFNHGDIPVKPVIYILGAVSSVTITDENGNTFSYNGSLAENYPLIIDCSRCICLYQGADVTANSSGEFIELRSGNNCYTVSINGNGKIEFDFSYKYFYDSNYTVYVGR